MVLTIGKRLALGFSLVVALTAGLGGFTYMSLTSIRHSLTSIQSDSFPGTTLAAGMESDQQTLAMNVLEQLNATDPAEIAALETERLKVKAKLDKSMEDYTATIFTPEDKDNFEAVKKNRAEYLKLLEHTQDLRKAGKNEEAKAYFHKDAAPVLQTLLASFQRVFEFNERNGIVQMNDLDKTGNRAVTNVMIGVSSTLLAAVVFGWFTARGINKTVSRLSNQMSTGAAQVSSAAQQVASSSQSLAQGASEQAASLEETSSSLEEMSSMTKKTADTARQASALSADTKSSADRGNVAMVKMTQAIESIQKASSETAKIVKTIDEIAFQTNLLALNAAVEAARAGEAGKGFAVVAEEVRNLAMRSAQAAKTTSTLIEGNVASSKNGVTITQEVSMTLIEIQQSVEKVNGLIAEIAAASQEQSQGIGQVNQAVQQMDKVTQGNAAASEESAAAAEELSSQSEQLVGLVGDLNTLVSGKAGPATLAAPNLRNNTPRRFPKHAPTLRTRANAEHAIPLDTSADDKDFSDFSAKT